MGPLVRSKGHNGAPEQSEQLETLTCRSDVVAEIEVCSQWRRLRSAQGGRPGVDERIILKLIFDKKRVKEWSRLK